VVVTLAQRPSEPVAKAPAAQTHRASVLPPDRGTLARELQQELRRVGCYDGEINGAWTPRTRKAMKAFTDRVNATLPIDEPDYILLSLVQGHQERACGKPCPAGQALAEDSSRCLPKAIIAQGARKAVPVAVAAAPQRPMPAPARPEPAVTAWTATATPAAAPPVPPMEGRMALSGPGAEPRALEPGSQLAVPARPHSAAPPPPTGHQRGYERRPPRYAARPSGYRPRFGPSIFRQLDSARQ
jgi:peptidoglycan hydrolase-like protein with peptidoglycan-binding domain